jgi:hypothetical protein
MTGLRWLARGAVFKFRNVLWSILPARKVKPIRGGSKPTGIKRVLVLMVPGQEQMVSAMRDIVDVKTVEVNKFSKEELDAEIRRCAFSGDYDLLFFVLMRDEFSFKTIREISEKSNTLTLNWFCDDAWRFETFSSRWAAAFNFCATTEKSALPKYERIGYKNIILTEWAANPKMCIPSEYIREMDVSFVGQKYGNREAVIEKLKRQGIVVETFGVGWLNGAVSNQKMIDIFAGSKISLCPMDCSVPFMGVQAKARPYEVRAAGGFPLEFEEKEDIRPQIRKILEATKSSVSRTKCPSYQERFDSMFEIITKRRLTWEQ